MSGLEQTLITTMGLLIGALIGAIATYSGVSKQANIQKTRETDEEREEATANLTSLKRYILKLYFQLVFARIRFDYHSSSIIERTRLGEQIGSVSMQFEYGETDSWRSVNSKLLDSIIEAERELDKCLIRIKHIFISSDELSLEVDEMLNLSVPTYDGSGVAVDFTLSGKEVDELIAGESSNFQETIKSAWGSKIDQIVTLLTEKEDKNKKIVFSPDQEAMIVSLAKYIKRTAIKIWNQEI